MASRFDFEAIGTLWQIDIYESLSSENEAGLFSLLKERIAVFDKAYSRFRADSLVTQISKQSGNYILPDDALPMMSLYQDLYKLTDGLFTPLIGQVLVDAGYDAEYSLTKKKILQIPLKWEEVFTYSHPYLNTKIPVLLDFGACGKGYLIDLVAEVLEKNNISSYCIDAGGDILHKNNVPMRVGLENPDNETEAIGVVTLQNQSICGSAGNRRKWEGFHHIIDPKKLSSPTHILSVWVVAERALLADALTTCLFFVEPKILLDKYTFTYCILYSDFSIAKSANFQGEMFTKE